MLEMRKVYVVERRDQVDIIAGILEAAKENGGTKTQIMHSANLNHQQIEKYPNKEGFAEKRKTKEEETF